MFNRIGKEQDSPESRTKLKVLCVDDEYVITNIMERILDEHYQVFTASSGFEGLDILKQHPDTVVIVSDQKMEGMTGNEFLMKSQEIAPEAMRIMVTAYSDIDLVIDSINKGQIYKFIPKPFDAEHFRVTIHRAVDHYHHKIAYEKAFRELQAAQEGLVRAEKLSALGKLLSDVSHELGGPIANINHAVTLAQHEWKDLKEFLDTVTSANFSAIDVQLLMREKRVAELTHDFEQMMETIANASVFAMDLLSELKGFARNDDQQWIAVDIEKQIERALHLLRIKYKNKITFHKDYTPLPSIKGLPGPLTQVMVNLLQNSAQSIQKEGHIWIRTWRGPDGIRVSIKDDGQGIAEEHISQVFDPGFTTKPEAEGTGFGLAISQAIIQKHGGSIAVTSVLGKGTEFIISLPWEQALSA